MVVRVSGGGGLQLYHPPPCHGFLHYFLDINPNINKRICCNILEKKKEKKVVTRICSWHGSFNFNHQTISLPSSSSSSSPPEALRLHLHLHPHPVDCSNNWKYKYDHDHLSSSFTCKSGETRSRKNKKSEESKKSQFPIFISHFLKPQKCVGVVSQLKKTNYTRKHNYGLIRYGMVVKDASRYQNQWQ